MTLIKSSVEPLPYKLLDFDQHSYEADDCFTRYMPKDKLDTAIYPVRTKSGRSALIANDRLVTALETAGERDTVPVPGSLAEMLRLRAAGEPSDSERFSMSMQSEFRDHDARLKQLDEQQIERSIMYPGGWALMAEAYLDDTAVLYDNLRSFNRWMNEDWGFSYQDRIYAPAMLSLRDRDLACAELDRVLDAGARFLVLPCGPAYGRSPGDTYFDPFWARVNEARAVIAYHISEFHYQANVASAWGWGLVPPFRFSAWQWQNTYGERPITDTLSALIFDNLFGRFPDLNVLVAEFGASWVPHFIGHMDKSRGMGRNGPWIGGKLTERPSAIFRRHVRVAPYPEDDIPKIAADLPDVDCLVMGSDFPHAEGLAEPAAFAALLDGLTEAQKRQILRDNAARLLTTT
jgi:predicted TIM-barrel fold metal-dependent hydrolase